MTRILLVEDARDLAHVIMQDLEAHGYCVFHASDGVDALQVQEAEQPSLVILDWMLPKLDGLEVLRGCERYYDAPNSCSKCGG